MTEENSLPSSNQPIANTPDLRTSAIGSILLLCLLRWLLISITSSGVIKPSSGITGKLWFFVNAGGLILAIALYGSAVRLAWRDAWLLGILLMVNFRFWSNALDFRIGQSNNLLLGLIGLLLYLMLRRQWKPLFGSIAGFAVSLVLSFLLIGFNHLPALLRVLQESKAPQEGQEVQSSIIGFANASLHANPFFTLFDPSYQHGLKSLLVSMKFFGTVGLWAIGMMTLRRLRHFETVRTTDEAFVLRTQVER